MRKLLSIFALAGVLFTLTSCEYDDADLWGAVNDIEDRVETLEKASDQMNADIKSLQSILEAMQNNVTITGVVSTENGYKISFSDGTEATITNGADGVSAPEISVRKDEDGLYYWTSGGEWLLVDGQKVRATALDGKDATAPEVRINTETGEWEISTDEGATWQSTGVSAKGEAGDSVFASVDTSNPDYVEFTLTNGTQFRVPRNDSGAPVFAVENADGVQLIEWGQSQEYRVTTSNMASCSINKPDGWRASFAEDKLTITAPVMENTFAEQEGSVDITVISQTGISMIVRVQVKAVTIERRVLTFEDADAKFTPYTLDYCSKDIAKWSDLIDDKQYGGPLLYGDGMGMDSPYYWYDEGNTELAHVMPYSEMYGSYCFWSGGHAVSNYAGTDLSQGTFTNQLLVYGAGGHNGSANFAIHYGYWDNSGYTFEDGLPELMFYDGVERVVESMWIMNTVYAMNCYVSGNGLTAQIGPDDWVKLVATGYNAAGDKVGETSFYTCNGPDHIVRDWTKWDLSVLGKVARIRFNVTGSSDNGYGFSQPAYFAYDDVTVRFE